MARNRDTGVSLAWMARPFGWLLKLLGLVFLFALVVALTDLPWSVYRWLGAMEGNGQGAPDLIVMMGGGGIPSESGLMRTWQAAYEAAKYPKARVLVAMPYEPGEGGTNRSAIQRELMLRGVSEGRLLQEGRGRHTREQAMLTYQLFEESAEHTRVLIVTSPEHVRRSVLAFRKAGFPMVRGHGALEQNLEAPLDYGRPSASAPSEEKSIVGQSVMMRYHFWNTLEVEVRVVRELVALWYYRAKGWV